MSRTKISETAPEWFHVITENKQREWNNKAANSEESLSVFSRFQKWITVTPKSKNRRKPLEKVKNIKMEETSKIMPNWMQIKVKKEDLPEDKFRTAEYNSVRHGKKTVVVVDKNINSFPLNKDGKSVFSIGDYRHNVPHSAEAQAHCLIVSHQPKQFFQWDDGKVFNPKFKRDKSENRLLIKNE